MPCLSRKFPSNKHCQFFIVAAAWALCTSFAAPLAQAQPAGALPNAATKVPPSGPSTSTKDDKLAPWAKIRNIDWKKLERLRICVQAQGAQADVFQAINICAPCVSSETVAAAGLTAQERQCLNRQPGSNDSSSSKGSPIPGHNPLPSRANPQCSGTKTGHRPQADEALDQAYARYGEAFAAFQTASNELDDHLDNPHATIDDAWGDRFWQLYTVRERRRAELHRAEAALREEERDYNSSSRWVVDMLARFFASDETNDPVVKNPGDLNEPGKDPRCPGKTTAAGWGSPWQDMCRGSDGHIDPMKCARRLTTVIGAVTNGRCWAEPGKDDAPTVVCKDENGQPVATGVDPSAQPTTPGATSVNDPTPWNRPNPGKGTAGPFIPSSPIGGFMEELCANGRCPDPLPTLGKITTAPNGSTRESRRTPPADQECLKRSKKTCRVSSKPSNLPSIDATELEPRWKKKLWVKKRWNRKPWLKKRWNRKRRIRARRQFDVPGIAKRRFRRQRFTDHRMMQRRTLQFRRSTFSRRRQFRTFRSRRSSFSNRANIRFSFGR